MEIPHHAVRCGLAQDEPAMVVGRKGDQSPHTTHCSNTPTPAKSYIQYCIQHVLMHARKDYMVSIKQIIHGIS